MLPAPPTDAPRPALPACLKQLEERIAGSDLPTLPMVAVQVSRLSISPLTGLSEIVRVIRTDPALTAKVLRVANSALYGMPRKIESLSMALVVLGMRELNHLVTCVTAMKSFPPAEEAAGFRAREFWEHSAACGEVARVVAARLRLRLRGVEFTAGLLHDIGKIVFVQYLPREYEQVRQCRQSARLSEVEAEQNVLGIDHAETGAWLAEKWALPSSIVCAIRYHHRPQQAPEHGLLAAVVRLADLLATGLLGHTGKAELHEVLAEDPAWDVIARQHPEILNLDIIRFIEELEENLERAREFIRLASE